MQRGKTGIGHHGECSDVDAAAGMAAITDGEEESSDGDGLHSDKALQRHSGKEQESIG